jgi:hypothetical protein
VSKINAERATIFVNHPMFQGIVAYDQLERRAVLAEARVKELDEALAVACERYRKAALKLKKARANAKK